MKAMWATFSPSIGVSPDSTPNASTLPMPFNTKAREPFDEKFHWGGKSVDSLREEATNCSPATKGLSHAAAALG
jgi:hypothetical protein